MRNAKHIIKAVLSALIWGLGQLFNRQYVKALIFFLIFVLFIGIEVGTSKYLVNEPFDLYQARIPGENLGNEGLRKDFAYITGVFPAVPTVVYKLHDPVWDAFLAEKGSSLTFTDIQTFAGQRIREIHDRELINIQNQAEAIAVANATTFATTRANDRMAELGQVKEDNEALWTSFYNTAYGPRYASQYNSNFNRIYDETMLADGFLAALKSHFSDVANNNPSYMIITGDDWNHTLLRIYFEAFPEEYEVVYASFNNFFHEEAGFFIKGLWSVVSLGETPMKILSGNTEIDFLMPAGRLAIEFRVDGHHSTRLLLTGIISTLTMFYFIFFWIFSIRDAYRTSKRNEQGLKISERQYFKELYHNMFEYIVLTPAIILLTYVMVMPIVFSLFIAFTNYDANHIPPGQLVSWVGFANFRSLFAFSGGGGSINFGEAFWRVFSWTLIWATAATFTCFFGGFIQAVILNNKRVVFRKVWRAFLILPWAVPALVSQLMFKLIFHGEGIVNKFLEATGANDFLRSVGALGKPMSEVLEADFLTKLIYLGNDSINWLTNEVNPWAVRIFIILLNIWLGFPFFMALMTGVMTNISRDLYEAAEIDGATAFQQFMGITMPLVLYATSPLLIMTFAGNFNNFGVIYFITGGGPGGGGDAARAYAGYTDILISWIYKLTTDDAIRWYSMASVFSILIFLIIGSISSWNFLRTKAFKEEDML